MSRLIVISAGATIRDVCHASVDRLNAPGVTLQCFDNWTQIKWPTAKTVQLVVVSELAALPKTHIAMPKAERLKHLLFTDRNTPPQSLPSIMALGVRDPKRIHIATRDSDDDAEALIYRTLCGFTENDRADRIIDAWWQGDTLEILTPEFDRLPIPLAKLAGVLGKDRRVLADFEIDADGSFIHWRKPDVHLGWEQFACLTSDDALNTVKSFQTVFNREYGVAIKTLREEYSLRQSDIRGLSARHIGRIEKGECRATRATLAKLAHAHGLTLSDYLRALSHQM